MRPKAVITYGNPRVSEEKVTTKFTLYGDTNAMKVQHHKYTGASDYELMKAHRALWSMIDDNELLANDQDTPARTRRRTRTAQENIIETFMPELPDDPDERRVEVNKRFQYKKQLRKVAFRAARNIYDDDAAAEAFAAPMEEERETWNNKEAGRRQTRGMVQ